MIRMPVRAPKSSSRVESAELTSTYTNDRDKWWPTDRHFIPFHHGEDKGAISPQFEGLVPKVVPFHEISLHHLARVDESAIRDRIEEKLLGSGFPLRDVRCHVTDSKIVLSGHVNRYYYLQMTLRIAFNLSEGRRIENQVEVLALARR